MCRCCLDKQCQRNRLVEYRYCLGNERYQKSRLVECRCCLDRRCLKTEAECLMRRLMETIPCLMAHWKIRLMRDRSLFLRGCSRMGLGMGSTLYQKERCSTPYPKDKGQFQREHCMSRCLKERCTSQCPMGSDQCLKECSLSRCQRDSCKSLSLRGSYPYRKDIASLCQMDSCTIPCRRDMILFRKDS